MDVKIERKKAAEKGLEKGSYEYVVRFTRNASEDEAIVESEDPLVHMRHFVEELQEYAFEEGSMAGNFQVEAVIVYE